MDNIEIENEIQRLTNLRHLNNAKTRDGKPIEIGKTYYVLNSYSLTKGCKEILIKDDYEFQNDSIYKKVPYNFVARYCDLFSSKKEAIKYMRNLLENRIEQFQNDLKNTKVSLKLLEKLENEL